MKKNQQGFIGLIIVLIFALSLAKYVLHWDVIAFIKSAKFIEILTYIKKALLIVWKTLLVTPVTFVWNKVVVGIIWKTIVTAYGLLTVWVDKQS
jgi:hypothetical protein